MWARARACRTWERSRASGGVSAPSSLARGIKPHGGVVTDGHCRVRARGKETLRETGNLPSGGGFAVNFFSGQTTKTNFAVSCRRQRKTDGKIGFAVFQKKYRQQTINFVVCLLYNRRQSSLSSVIGRWQSLLFAVCIFINRRQRENTPRGSITRMYDVARSKTQIQFDRIHRT